MLLGVTFVVVGLLPAYATGQLMITDAKCLLGYEWTFNTLNQSPCDVAASLAAVCSPTGDFNLDPLPSDYVYSGPPTEFANSCRCSSVYYSMLSACGYCQGRNFQNWSEYRTNCSTVSLQSYNQPLPSGVKVPAWAYLNVLDGDNFNITLAQRTRGTESSRLPVSGTPSSTTSSITWSPPPATLTVVGGGGGSQTNVGAIAGGVTGGVILIIISLVAIVLLRNRWLSSTTSANFQSLQATRSNMTSPNSFPPTPGLDNFEGGPLIRPQQSPFVPSLTTHSGRQTMHPQMMAQTQNDTRYTMITPQSTNTMSTNTMSTNTILTPQNTNTPPPTQNTNTMAPTQYVMHSTQNMWHQTRNTALPAQDMTPMHNTTQNVIPALPRQNSTTNLPSRQNLTQSMISTSSRQNLTQSMISTSSRQNLMSIPSSTQGVISRPAEQSSTQNVVPMLPGQDMRQNTMPSTQDVPWSPPQYTVDPF